jgi:glycine/D-amino acid oxidase-like deaminating enzyme
MASSTSTVILGAGIMGCSTAYYLSRDSSKAQSIHLVDPSETLFASASGNAGGFLAKDWFGPELASLGELSFNLHRSLAEENDGRKKWGYSGTTSMSMSLGKAGEKSGDNWFQVGSSRADAYQGDKQGGVGNVPWLRDGVGSLTVLNGAESSAQV